MFKTKYSKNQRKMLKKKILIFRNNNDIPANCDDNISNLSNEKITRGGEKSLCGEIRGVVYTPRV